jgi:MarR family transcriptional regulator, organic hydroperoxide resistance regulator
MKYDESVKYFSYGDEDQDMWLLLTHTRYAVFRAREKELQRYGISPEQASVLFVVQALGNKATPAAISRLIIRQPHTVSALVDRMTKRGLVRKIKDLDRKNLVRVALTEKGEKAYALSSKRGPIHRIMSILTEQERVQFKSVLEKLMAKARKEIGIDRDEPSFID